MFVTKRAMGVAFAAALMATTAVVLVLAQRPAREGSVLQLLLLADVGAEEPCQSVEELVAVAAVLQAGALGLAGEVIVPSLTFIASAHCLQWQQITPVFCDIDPATFNVDPKSLKSKVTKRTKAIMPVHLFGQLARMEASMKLNSIH